MTPVLTFLTFQNLFCETMELLYEQEEHVRKFRYKRLLNLAWL